MMVNKLFTFITIVLTVLSCKGQETGADNRFDVSVKEPQLKNIKPAILFDEAHKNHHKIETTYKPFAALITNDGCTVTSTAELIDKNLLLKTDVFVIATAMGKEDPGDKSPFSENEITQLESWVAGGGSLLLVTEHFPFGLSMKPVLNRFGVQVHNGYTEDSLLNNKEVADALIFTKATGNLNSSHPILSKIERINTFTGSSVMGDSTWTPLLIFSPAAQNFNVKVTTKKNGDDIVTNVEYADPYPAKGYAQAICKEYGKGKIVVLAESAFITAQLDRKGNKYGMNLPNEDNKQFVLNMIRWLAKK